jgi:hypothetical protein
MYVTNDLGIFFDENLVKTLLILSQITSLYAEKVITTLFFSKKLLIFVGNW